MKVILLKTVAKLGRTGDVKSVADGYARNYLLPNNLAAPASVERLADIEARAVKQEKEAAKAASFSERVQKRLAGQRFQFSALANKQGKLFAGVTADIISDILKRKGHDIKPTMIEIAQALKQIGDHEVVIDFGSSGKAAIIVEVKAI